MPQAAKATGESTKSHVSSVWPVLALGALAWLAHVGWLQSTLGPQAQPLVWALAPLALLGVGAAALWTQGVAGLWVTRVAWLGLYPAALVCSAAWTPQAALEPVLSPVSVSLSAVALLSYCVGAVVACSQPLPAAIHSVPLSATGPRRPRSPHDLVRRGFAVLWIGTALALSTVAPLSPAYTEVQRTWGDSAASGAVLAAVVAAALGASSVAVFLGSMLRRSDAEPPLRPAAMRTRVATLLLSALLSSAAYFALAR